MKSPSELSQRLAKQWQNGQLRELRLLEDEFPIILPIGKPTAQLVKSTTHLVKHHLDLWRNVTLGEVVYADKSYRATGSDSLVSIPTHWKIGNLTQWVDASADKTVKAEATFLKVLLENADELFHSFLVRKRSYWKKMDLLEALKALELVQILEPNCAKGVPLRAFSVAGIDTKFFERNRSFILALLDIRFDGLASELGLEGFLGAWRESDHWLLVLDLDPEGGLLPFTQMRVRTTELLTEFCRVKHCLIVENVKCLHLIPKMKNTIAILGAGLDLLWTKAEWLKSVRVAYWGDIDTWGLAMLSTVRRNIPHVNNLLMTEEVFESHAEQSAVVEKTIVARELLTHLTESELRLYDKLVSLGIGRLEQEFIGVDRVREEIIEWEKEAIDNECHLD